MLYRAVFCDMDGTLLNTSHIIPPATARAVRELGESGTPFIAVSARSPVSMYPLLDGIVNSAPMVSYGGALILDKNRSTVQSLEIPSNTVLEIKQRIAASRPDVSTTVYSFDDWVTDDASDPRIILEMEITRSPVIEADFRDVISGGIHKVFCIGDRIEEVESDLKAAYPALSIAKSSPVFLEITHGDANKANAVHCLCRAMRLSPGECVAFGDNFNDIGMLQAVGCGVAMGNAPDAVKEHADAVTGTNDDEGVRRMLETLPFAKMVNSVRFDRGAV